MPDGIDFGVTDNRDATRAPLTVVGRPSQGGQVASPTRSSGEAGITRNKSGVGPPRFARTAAGGSSPGAAISGSARTPVARPPTAPGRGPDALAALVDWLRSPALRRAVWLMLGGLLITRRADRDARHRGRDPRVRAHLLARRFKGSSDLADWRPRGRCQRKAHSQFCR